MAEMSIFNRLLGRPHPSVAPQPSPFAHLCAPQDGYVFVVSYGLSGDVLVQDLLNSVPGVVVRGENGNLMQPIANAWHHAERAVLAAFATHQDDAPQQMEDLTLLGWHLANSFARDVLALPEGARMAGFREIRIHGDAPAFKRQLDFMAAFFPNARFIFETRDVHKVARTGWWRDRDTAEVQQTLAEADSLFELYRTINPTRSLHLHYDSYIDDPSQLSTMFDWLGLPKPAQPLIDQILAKHRAALDAETAS